MLFNSWQYLVFLPAVFAVYWILPKKWKLVRTILLLAASYYFYMSWNVKYVVLILFTTLVSYGAGILLERTEKKGLKKLVVASAAVLCFAVLFFFKYFGFAFDTLNRIVSLFGLPMNPITLNLMLPVGISFYTFQTVSYVIDVYRKDTAAEKNILYYATFVSFFPQLVAGPIERTRNLLPQLRIEHKFQPDKAMAGFKLLLIGYFKKLVIADTVAGYVDTVYGALPEYQGVNLLLVIFLFAIQIYCDFSGYSDIAIGTAKLLDIDLMKNFKSPYYSASVREFWSRWHISLSTWFRDYLYIPMGGSRCGRIRHAFNTLVTFLVSGLWHGANWTFVLWGALHGVMQIIENLLKKVLDPFRKNRAGHVVSVIFVFLFTCFAWVFFRAQSFTDAIYVIKTAFFTKFSHVKTRIFTMYQFIVP